MNDRMRRIHCIHLVGIGTEWVMIAGVFARKSLNLEILIGIRPLFDHAAHARVGKGSIKQLWTTYHAQTPDIWTGGDGVTIPGP